MSKVVVVILLLTVIYTMGSALYFMMRDDDTSKRTVRALSFRIALSILAIVTLLMSAYFGWITPNF